MNSISELLRKREEDLERYQVDLRATRTKATEMEVQSAHTKILLEAAETESKAFKVSHHLFI
uniref:Mitofilin n=1 Tax=Parascaris equorum TaxID=6256 RepID=A0A914RKG8_PAREQ